jgi:hypothetical protein
MSMSFNATCRRLLPLTLSLLLSGCASQIQKTLDRTIQIEKRCTAIEEALPMEQQYLKSALVDAVALRLVGSCLDDNQLCLNSSDTTIPLKLTGSVQQMATGLQNQRTQLQQAGKAFDDGLRQDYATLQRDLTQTKKDTEDALNALRAELSTAKSTLLSNSKTCSQRTDCMTVFADQFGTLETRLVPIIDKLRTQAKRLPELAQQAAALADRSTLLLKQTKEVADGTRTLLIKGNEDLQADARQLNDRARQLGQRLENGSRTLENLFSHDVEKAMMDLMAANIYDKSADRLLALIDRMLSQLDHTIDKIDDHAFGVASVATQMFSGEMQDRFDAIFRKLFAERYTSNTAKLAFASAACRRMGVGNDAAPQTASMFTPFLYAALIRVEYDVNGQKGSLEDVRKAWESQLGKKPDEVAKDAGVASADRNFAQNVAAASQKDAASQPNKPPVAPDMLQKVALCAGVEQELAMQGVTGNALKEQTVADCGHAALDATLANRPMVKAGSPSSALAAIATAPPASTSLSSGNIPGAGSADAWSKAMLEVLAASRPKVPELFDALCRQISSQIKGSRCAGGVADSATVDFDASFGPGQARDKGIEMQLAQLADILAGNPQDYRLLVTAYASHQLPPCPGKTAADIQACATAKNAALAQSRADWAYGILERRMAGRFGIGNQKHGSANPLSYDTPTDRRLRITLWPSQKP